MEQKTNCDLCGSTKLGLLYKLSGFNIRQCNECGLVFRDVILNEQETKRLYGEHYFQDEQKDYFFVNIDYKKKIFASKLRRVEHFYPGKGKLLDIGCAIGTFLLIARESGWEVKGVEVSEFASEYARKNFNLFFQAEDGIGDVSDRGLPSDPLAGIHARRFLYADTLRPRLPLQVYFLLSDARRPLQAAPSGKGHNGNAFIERKLRDQPFSV